MQNEDSTATTTPFDFRIHNRQGQSVLYTRLLLQSMTLELHNTSKSPLALETSKSDYHFQLRFRLGMLVKHEKIKLNEKDKVNWALSIPIATGEAAHREPENILLNLRYQGAPALLLDPGNQISISLQDIVVDDRLGSHSTQVELKYQKLVSEGDDKLLNGTCRHYISIINSEPRPF
jgi:hypothetical protein